MLWAVHIWWMMMAVSACLAGKLSDFLCRAGEARQRQRQQGADSYIGAIMDVCDADDGEVVEEDGMFDMVYSGHCNKQGCKEVRSLQLLYQDLLSAPFFFYVFRGLPGTPSQAKSGCEDVELLWS